MTGATATKSVSVDLTGKTSLGLVITNGGNTVDYDHGDWADAKVICGNTPPVPTITSPSSTLTYKVGDVITFAGSATDPEDGTVPAGRSRLASRLHHCPGGGPPYALLPILPSAGPEASSCLTTATTTISRSS